MHLLRKLILRDLHRFEVISRSGGHSGSNSGSILIARLSRWLRVAQCLRDILLRLVPHRVIIQCIRNGHALRSLLSPVESLMNDSVRARDIHETRIRETHIRPLSIPPFQSLPPSSHSLLAILLGVHFAFYRRARRARYMRPM